VSVQIRLTEAQAASLDAWREVQPEKPSRSEAIRRLLTAALDPKA
jgi:Arc/MetJ-type ribon-helix-helix transcriptional regulator